MAAEKYNKSDPVNLASGYEVKIKKIGTISFKDMQGALQEIGFDLLEKSNNEIFLDNEQQINIWNNTRFRLYSYIFLKYSF